MHAVWNRRLSVVFFFREMWSPLKRFLVSANNYSKFIRHYGSIATPVNGLIRKNDFIWISKLTKTFIGFKRAVTQPPILKLYEFSQSFTIECDASSRGISQLHIWVRFLKLSYNENEPFDLVTVIKNGTLISWAYLSSLKRNIRH